LKRSSMVGTYRGFWGGVAGYIEDLESPYDAAIKEIRQEVGLSLDSLELVRSADPLEISDTYEGRRYDWLVFPFLFHISGKETICVNWEHEEHRWITPREARAFKTVPGFDSVLSVLFGEHDIL